MRRLVATPKCSADVESPTLCCRFADYSPEVRARKLAETSGRRALGSSRRRRVRCQCSPWVASQEVEAHAISLQNKDAALLALRAEGDALSRKQARAAPRATPAPATAANFAGFAQSEVEASARKLRATLKDTETQRDELRQRLETLEQEAQNSQRIVQASSVEVQSEAARAEKEALDREAALQASVAAHATRIASLQATLAAAETRSASREDALRAQLASTERRCQELEAARDDLIATNTEATVPILRELEAVNAAAARASDAAADTEARLLSRLQVCARMSSANAKLRCAF